MLKMPRKSSRLAAKKRVNYNEDSLWYRALGKGKDAWNEMIEVVADDPPPVKKPWQKKKPKKLFQKKKLFRKKPPKVKKVLKRTKALIEKDEAEIDYPDTPEQRVDRILKVPDKKVKAVSRLTQELSRKRKHLLFMNPGDVPIQTAILARQRGAPPRVGRTLPEPVGTDERAPDLDGSRRDTAHGSPGREADGREEAVLRPPGTGHDPPNRGKTLQSLGEY